MTQELVEFISGTKNGREASIPEDEGESAYFVFVRHGVQVQIMDGGEGYQFNNHDQFCVEITDPLEIYNLRYVCGKQPVPGVRRGFIASSEIMEVDGPVSELMLEMVRSDPDDTTREKCNRFQRAFERCQKEMENKRSNDGPHSAKVSPPKRNVQSPKRNNVQQRRPDGPRSGREYGEDATGSEQRGEGDGQGEGSKEGQASTKAASNANADQKESTKEKSPQGQKHQTQSQRYENQNRQGG